MTRSRASSKSAGTKYETAVARYFTEKTNKLTIRMPKTGSLDCGDIFGVTYNNELIAIECKSPGKDQSYKVPKWLRETIAETENSGSLAGILLIKKYRKKVEESLCVLTEEHAVSLGLELHDIPVRKAKSYDVWWEHLEELEYVRVPVRGDKDNNYVITKLNHIVKLFDIHKEKIDLEFTEDELEELTQHGYIEIEPEYQGMPMITITIVK